MFRVLSILSLVLFAESFLSAQNSRSHMKAAEQFIANGYYEDAINQYNSAINLDPQYGEAYEARANAYLYLNKLEDASSDFERAAVFEVNPAINYFKSAEIQFKLGKDKTALETLEKSIEINGNYLEAYILQYSIYFKAEDYLKALESAIKATNIKSSAYNFYLKGKAEYTLKDYPSAEQDFEKAITKDKLLFEAYLDLAKLQIELKSPQKALDNCNYVIQNNQNNAEAYSIRSIANKTLYNPTKAIDDITKAISIDSSNTNYILIRGECYVDIAKYEEAINDFNLVLNKDFVNTKAILDRASAYEKLRKNKEAASDYTLYLTLSDKSDTELIKQIAEKVYKLRQEFNKPVITIINPNLTKNFEIPIPSDMENLKLKGLLSDESKIKLFRVNNDTLINNADGSLPAEFNLTLNSKDLEFLTISATDIYNNTSNVSYSIVRIETHPPQVSLMNPYVGDDNIISLTTNDNYLYLEGKISDESLISNIKIDELNASYAPGDINPRFTANVDISKKTKINITVTDIYGNSAEKEYLFVRDGRVLNEDSPMGKTWAILIENSEYKSFTNLRSTSNDIVLIQKSLTRYKFNNVIIKKNLTKRELERFFSIDLRDLIRTNHVNSLFIWFAGHGANINGNGYWIPTDALVDDEFTYYNINALKASLYSYNTLSHLLVVSDACTTGPGFCIAMRSPLNEVTCSQTDLTLKKSAQVFTSSGTGNAYDNSLFASSFGNSLLNNENDCVSIDEIVKRVTIILQTNTLQSPEFGKITGLDDQLGTFFFISR